MIRSAARLFRLDPGPSGLALCCDETGLSLAGVALLQKTEAGFEPRPREALDLLFKATGGDEDRPHALSSSGLAAVAAALNRGDLAKAQMTALFLRPPKLDAAAVARLAQADEALAKGANDAYLHEDRNARGRWIHGGGGSAATVGQDKATTDGLRGPLSPAGFPPPAAPKVPHSSAPAPQHLVLPRRPHGMPTPEEAAGSFVAQRTTPLNSQKVQALVDAQNAAMANPKYQRNKVTGDTYCNFGTAEIARKVGVDFPGLYKTKGVANKANDLAVSLAKPGSGYHWVKPEQAQVLTNQGVLVFGTQIRGGGHSGHIVTVRPEGVPGDKPMASLSSMSRGEPDKIFPILANIGLFNGVSHEELAMVRGHGLINYYAPDR